MGALTIEEVEIPAQRRARLGDGVVGLEVDLLVLHRPPEPLDEDVVAPGALAVHADGDPVRLEDAGERLAGELAALVAVENLGLAVFADRPSRRAADTGRSCGRARVCWCSVDDRAPRFPCASSTSRHADGRPPCP